MMIMNWIKRIVGGHTTDKVDSKAAAADPTPSVRGAPPPTRLIDADETLAGEFTRARRYEQPLTIVVVSMVQLEESHIPHPGSNGGPGSNGRSGSNGGPGSNGDGATGPDVLPLLVAIGLREALRESDVICYRHMDGRFVLGLPQADGEEARQAMARVGGLFRRRLHIDLMVGAAAFPTDGLTLADLEGTARGRAESLDVRAGSTDSDEDRPPRETPSRRVRPRSTARPSRNGAPQEVSQEGVGSE